MTKKREAVKVMVWQATTIYEDGHSIKFLPKNTTRFKGPTPYMQALIFTKYEAHYAAFGQSGFHIKKIDLSQVNIEYNKTNGEVKVL